MSRFVVVFKGNSDPSRAEMRSLMSALGRSVQVVDRMPGTILVDGTETAVASVVGPRPNWGFSPEGGATIGPRHARPKQAA